MVRVGVAAMIRGNALRNDHCPLASTTVMAAHSFPDLVFEDLLVKLVKTIETAQSPESTLNQGARQALFQAVRDRSIDDRASSCFRVGDASA